MTIPAVDRAQRTTALNNFCINSTSLYNIVQLIVHLTLIHKLLGPLTQQ